jgi:HAE1 family hydrophobic/amphiphilic exporter-1
MIRFCVRHPVATWMLFTALIICGMYALPRLSIEAMPETDLPSLSIETFWNGASPSAVQRSITIPIEEAARQCHGIEELTSRSSPGRSSVTISFRRDVDLDFARLELSEHLGAVRRNLPTSARQPVIVPIIPEEFRTDDFFSFSLVSPLSTNELREQGESWLLPRLLAVSGVADAELQGGARPLVKIYLDLQLVERYSLTADGIVNRLRALDDIIPAGSVHRKGQELTISVQDSVTLDMLRDTVLRTLGGQPIRLGHVAQLERSYEDPSMFVRINGENVIQANVLKRSGENAVRVSRSLRQALPAIQASMPFPVTFEIDDDQGEQLEEKLEELVYRSFIILALLFALLAFALRQVRLTAIVISSILLAIVICLSAFYFFGISVNFITISGLTVCFGMLLDNSILVLDAIHRRLHLRNGRTATEALIDGAREVAFPIISTTLTTVVAFLSFIFLSGRLSLYYVPLAVSVGIAMLASIFVAFCWIPVALRGPAARTLEKAPTEVADTSGNSAHLLRQWSLICLGLAVLGLAVLAVWKGFDEVADHWAWAVGILALMLLVGIFVSYVERITAFHLRHWWYPVLLTLGLFGGGWYVFKNEVHQGGFWRQQSDEQLRVWIALPEGTDVLLSSETMKLFEAEVLPVPDGVHMKSWNGENWAFMRMEFEDDLLRSAYPELFRNKLIMLAEELGGMTIYIGGFGDPYYKGTGGGMLNNSLIKITGYNSKQLERITDGVLARLERNRRVRNVRLTSGDRFERPGADETVVRIHRDVLEAHHLSVIEVLAFLRRLLGIEDPFHMILEGEDQRLQLAYADAADIQYEQVMSKVITTSSGEKVPLASLVSLETRPVIGVIQREDQRYMRQINWDYIGTDRMRQQFIQDILAGIQLPYGYTAEDVSGEMMSEEEEQEMKQILWVTVVFIFMVLAALFESLALPLLVLLAVPMALTGVVALFWITDTAFDSSAKIGLVLLFGIVVNNAILLINRFRLQLRELTAEKYFPPHLLPPTHRLGAVDLWRLPASTRDDLLQRAICSGIRIQLRSILLTSGTTIAGLLPLLIRLTDTQEGQDIWENLALCSIGGLVSSTVLIISAIPAVYWIMSRFGCVFLRAWHRFLPRLASRVQRPAPASTAS